MKILIAGLACAAVVGADQMPIGYVNHFPMIKHDDHLIPNTGADVIIVRAPWSLIEPRKGEFDFTMVDEQLQLAHDSGLKLICLLEAGPAHAAGVWWMIDELKASGEMMARKDGSPAGDPSIFSPTYKRYLERYVHTVVGYIANHKYADSVYGYNNGCEWWYPLDNSYSPLAAEALRGHLNSKYGSLRRLNEWWGTSFEDWDAVTPPKLTSIGASWHPQGYLLPDSAVIDACYCTTAETHVPVEPGEKLSVSARFTAEDVRSGEVTFEIAWLSATEPTPIHIDFSKSTGPLVDGEGAVTVEAVAPWNAAKAWLLMKCRAAARVTFHGVTCHNEAGEQVGPDPNLDPAIGAWQYIEWNAGEPERVEDGWDAPGEAWIRYDPVGALESGAQYPLAEVYDWMDFRASAFAGFIEWMAARIKEADATRPIVTYLTIAFSNAFEWDNAQQLGMELDHIAGLGEHLDVLGMQLASAEGDYDSVSCALDMVRKYGKPMWAIDLLDFTRGVALGRPGLTRTSMSVVQHGGSGIQYYCWWGTPHYNYAELGIDELRAMTVDVRALKAQVGAMEPVCEVALVMPRMPQYRMPADPPNDWADFMGWYKLLARIGVCPDVYTLEELANADLGGYGAVIVPDCAHILREALPALRGAKLVTSGRFAMRDMSGREIPRRQRPRPMTRFVQPLGTTLLGETYRQEPPTDVPPRLICRDGGPKWDPKLIAAATDALTDLGVEVPADPMNAPVTIVPFGEGGRRSAFVLPDREWSGSVKLGNQTHEVGPTGALVPIR